MQITIEGQTFTISVVGLLVTIMKNRKSRTVKASEMLSWFPEENKEEVVDAIGNLCENGYLVGMQVLYEPGLDFVYEVYDFSTEEREKMNDE